MKNIYRSAQGKAIDLDKLRVANEQAIAVGNMKINAGGDELGPGGVVVRTRDQVMKEYYQTNAVYTKEKIEDQQDAVQVARSASPIPTDDLSGLPADILEQDAQMPEEEPKLRGQLADAVAKSAKVEQKLLTPKKTSSGPSRI
jgi:hypothetical protein